MAVASFASSKFKQIFQKAPEIAQVWSAKPKPKPCSQLGIVKWRGMKAQRYQGDFCTDYYQVVCERKLP